jgi:uncharacterized protein
VSGAVARRFLVTRHLLAPPRSLPAEPASVLRVVDRLGSLQFDPIDVAGRNHDLTLNSRIAGYRRAWTDDLLYRDRVLYETYNKMLSLVPTAELPWYRHIWDRLEQAPLVEELLARIREHGPTSAADFESREAIDWYWRPTNPVRAMLEALAEAGILGIARREGNRRIYDLVGRLFPADLLAVRVPVEEQLCHKLLSRYRGNGLLGATGEYSLWMGIGKAPVRARVLSQLVDGGALMPVDVEGFRGPRFVVAGEVPILDAAEASVAAGERMPDPGVAFVAPLDPLVWDRDLLRRLFAFDYVWEVYVPAPKRRHGYYTLPVLYGDRLVGRLDPKADRKSGTLGVLGLWWEDGFDPLSDANPGFVDAFADALRAHLAFTGTKKVALPRVARHRTFVQAVRARL